MNLFEAIFVRKSVRSYTNEGISPKVLEDILKQFDEINGLFGGVETELAIFDNRQNDYKMLSILGIKAPYYLVLYSEEKDRAMMNAGYLMEQLSLYMYTREIGSCFIGTQQFQCHIPVRNRSISADSNIPRCQIIAYIINTRRRNRRCQSTHTN